MMRRVLILLATGCLVIICSVATRLMFQPPIQLLVSHDATDIEVVHSDWGEWTLTYRTAGPAYGWYHTVIQQLESNGWRRSGERYTGGPPHNPPTYTRMASFGLAAVWEQVELDGDPQVARLRLRQWITVRLPKVISRL